MKSINNLEKKITTVYLMKNNKTPFNVVINLIIILQQTILLLNINNIISKIFIIFAFISILFDLIYWKEEIEDRKFSKFYNSQNLYREYEIGFWLFLLSEFAIFFALFWALFHFSLSPSNNINNLWNTGLIENINWKGISTINTSLLIFSSIVLNFFETGYNLKITKKILSTILFLAINMGLVFIITQYIKFSKLPFIFYQTAYSNIFYCLTGLHLTHVLLGLLLLSLTLYNLNK